MRDSLSKPMTSRPAPVAAALVALLLGGCSLMPVYERPAAPVAEHWPGLAAPQGASAPVATLESADALGIAIAAQLRAGGARGVDPVAG